MVKKPTATRRDAIRTMGALGLGGYLATGGASADSYTIVGDRWYGHDSENVERIGGDMMDLSQHVAAEYVGSDTESGVHYRYFDITTVSVATYRETEIGEHKPALYQFGFNVKSGDNGSTSGIDRIDTDVVHAGRPKTESEVLDDPDYDLTESELDDVSKVDEEAKEEAGDADSVSTLAGLTGYILSKSSMPVLAAAGPYVSVASLALGVASLLLGTDEAPEGENYTWQYPTDTYAVGVAHYNSLPVHMDEDANGEFTVEGFLDADRIDGANGSMFETLSHEITVQYDDYDGGGM
ncbi:hypothetical protein NGM10_12615 [Halorussus salilacus]|uniref:hypothetical protein n=1 Tax=Halorussus salilacus TaxID=2953750 RepID=UPI0020A0DBEA|nr:hypothetical protein [Halorussus salilacus]USZ67566.1 hypothetical protein NGM10_12615 [Halorussus salilacus]